MTQFWPMTYKQKSACKWKFWNFSFPNINVISSFFYLLPSSSYLNVDKRTEKEQTSCYHEAGMKMTAKDGRAETQEEAGSWVVAASGDLLPDFQT